MDRPKVIERIILAEDNYKGTSINEDATTSKGKTMKIHTTGGKDKRKRTSSIRRLLPKTLRFHLRPEDFVQMCMSFWRTHTWQPLVDQEILFLLR